MPLGLKNYLVTFQWALDITPSMFRWKSCLVYISDFIFISPIAVQHICNVNEIIGFPQEASVTLKLYKCAIFTEKVSYLGHTIFSGTLAVVVADPAESIREAPSSTYKTRMWFFLGACNVYKWFVPDFAGVADRLTQL